MKTYSTMLSDLRTREELLEFVGNAALLEPLGLFMTEF